MSGVELTPQIEVSAMRGVQRVEYRLDKNYVATAVEMPFTPTISVSGLTTGNHTLEIVAFDDVGNKTTRMVSFQYEAAAVAPSTP